MAAVSDAVVIGIVLGLVFAAVSYYLFTRQSQLERKVSLMENILLDLKVTTEQTLLSATEHEEHSPNAIHTNYNHEEQGEQSEESTKETQVTPQTSSAVEQPSGSAIQNNQSSEDNTESINYESMTYKELVQIARQKGITGTRNMSKAQVLEALHALEGGISSSSRSTEAVPLTSWAAEDSDAKPIDQLSSAQEFGTSLSALEEEPETSLVANE